MVESVVTLIKKIIEIELITSKCVSQSSFPLFPRHKDWSLTRTHGWIFQERRIRIIKNVYAKMTSAECTSVSKTTRVIVRIDEASSNRWINWENKYFTFVVYFNCFVIPHNSLSLLTKFYQFILESCQKTKKEKQREKSAKKNFK